MDPRNSLTTGAQRVSSLLFLLVILIALAGYWVGSHFEREKLQDPAVRLEVALQALREGYDNTALRLFTPLANAGNVTAQYWLADLYEHGLGAERDPQKAIGLLTKSAGQGFVPAAARLGEIYLYGRLVLQDLQLAREWLSRAAMAGDDIAQYELSQIYERGLGVPADPVEAYAWAAVAATRGNALAQRERDRILASLSPEELARGEARAKEIVRPVASPTEASVNAGPTRPAQPDRTGPSPSASRE
jgi:TPR repeat protein